MKILDLEYSSRGRDIDIVEPTLSYLELTQQCEIKRDWIFQNPILSIILFRPDLVIVANGIGSYEHFMTVKFAALWGCKVVTFVSEGDYLEDENSTVEFFWGWNKDFITYEDLSLQWSERCINLINKYISPSSIAHTHIALSGATGFDKYRLCEFMDREKLKKKYKIKFNRIIGIAGWGFDHFFEGYYKNCIDNYSEDDVNNFKDSLGAVNQGYLEVVKKYPDILFILKMHPLLVNMEYSEFKGLEQFENVLLLKSEENIYDIIHVCDLWIAFESTTALEAWLLGKTTLLFNPLRSDFKRSLIADGSPIVKSVEELIDVINEFYETGKIECFENRRTDRAKIVSQVIGFADGKNFIRASEEICKLLDSDIPKKRIYNVFIFSMILDACRRVLRDFVVKWKIFLCIPLLSRRIKKYKKDWGGMYDQQERIQNAAYYKNYVKKFLKI